MAQRYWCEQVRAENLVFLRAHQATVEPVAPAEARKICSEMPGVGLGTVFVFLGVESPSEVVLNLLVRHIFPLLSRCTVWTGAAFGKRITAGQLNTASEVCRAWRGAALAVRALTPASARDVAMSSAAQGGEHADGEYRVWLHGDRSRPPCTLYCHNVLSARPTEFLSLPIEEGESTNFSCFPTGGSARGTMLVTAFRKVRLCPWTLLVKTDDFTFATSVGHIAQTYWNGARTLDLRALPYATARDSAGSTSGLNLANRGQAQLNLSGTGFTVRVDDFKPVGCNAFGTVGFGLAVEGLVQNAMNPEAALQPRLMLFGGGYAGRFTPRGDRTMDERASGGNFDDEGGNGGWVLELVPASTTSGSHSLQARGVHTVPIITVRNCAVTGDMQIGSSAADMNLFASA